MVLMRNEQPEGSFEQEGSCMTDREQDQAEALAERDQSLVQDAEILARRPVGEEIDPDAIRVVPDIDEDGNIIEDDIVDDPGPDE